ncbi:DUF882 domain-containing protein [Candidatus Margulisiibacteriota bacterium]
MYYINSDKKMTEKDWGKIKYMHYRMETWGEPFQVAFFLVFLIEAMRKIAKSPCILTCSAFAKSGHSENSPHGYGYAADLRFPRLSIFEMYRLATLFPFTGIGLYPKSNGGPFIHVDIKPIKKFQKRRGWIGIKKGKKSSGWKYLPLNEKNLRKYII